VQLALAEQLAGDELLPQVGKRGVDLAGGRARAVFRQAQAYAEKYGEAAEDYVKRSTVGARELSDGSVVQLHCVENVKTGRVYDVKKVSPPKR
jgi:hypothetical protein